MTRVNYFYIIGSLLINMPKTKSAQKALRGSKRKRKMNLERQDKLNTALKSFRKLVVAGKIEEAAKQLPAVYKALDKSAKTKLIKKGNANRLKSRLSKKVATNK